LLSGGVGLARPVVGLFCVPEDHLAQPFDFTHHVLLSQLRYALVVDAMPTFLDQFVGVGDVVEDVGVTPPVLRLFLLVLEPRLQAGQKRFVLKCFLLLLFLHGTQVRLLPHLRNGLVGSQPFVQHGFLMCSPLPDVLNLMVDVYMAKDSTFDDELGFNYGLQVWVFVVVELCGVLLCAGLAATAEEASD
jgi:hypothetical protein